MSLWILPLQDKFSLSSLAFKKVRFREASSLYYIFLQKALLNQASLEVTKAVVPDNKQTLMVNCLTQVQNIKAENGFCFTNSVHVWEAPMIMIAYSNELWLDMEILMTKTDLKVQYFGVLK